MTNPTEVNEYIAGFPPEIQVLLEQVRQTIKESAPKSVEVMSYGMPGYKLNGILVWFGGFKNHIGFFPKTAAIEIFKEELIGYKCSKGTVRFPYNKKIPFDLITKIVKFRAEENSQVKNKKNQIEKNSE
ncbi:MAG: DUF1801 domain-containing protein [Paludibacter sp.]|nr:DUF1801 domain-containing protein [Paludibacter sp.]